MLSVDPSHIAGRRKFRGRPGTTNFNHET